MPSAALPDRDEDRAALREVLRSAADAATQAALARALNVQANTVSGWVSGRTEVTLHALRRALRFVANRHPEAVPEVVGALVERFLGVTGRWVPEVQLDLLDVATASQALSIAHGAVLEANASGRPEVVSVALAQLSEASAALASAINRKN